MHACPIFMPLSNQRWEGVGQQSKSEDLPVIIILPGFRAKGKEYFSGQHHPE